MSDSLTSKDESIRGMGLDEVRSDPVAAWEQLGIRRREIERLRDALESIYTRGTPMSVEWEIAKAARKGFPVETTPVRHDVTCNYQRGPLYGPGCICIVVNKHVYERLEAAIVEISAVEPSVIPCGSESRPATAHTADTISASSSDGASAGKAGLEAGTAHRPRMESTIEQAMREFEDGTGPLSPEKATAPLREPQPDDFITCGYRDYPAYKAAHDEWKRRTSENGNGGQT